MAYISNNNQREIFVDTIKQKLIGPGGDVFGFPDEEELISIDPLKLYYSGILFPASFGETTTVTEEAEEINDGETVITPPDVEEENNVAAEEEENDPSSRLQSFYPRNLGLLFSVDNTCESVKVILSYAKYHLEKSMEIILSDDEHGLLQDLLNEIDEQQALSLIREDGDKTSIVFSNTTISEETKSTVLNSIKTKFWDVAKQNGHFLYSNEYLKSKFYKLLFKRDKFRRIPFFVELELPLRGIKSEISADEPNLHYHLRIIERANKKFVKILLSNESENEGRGTANCFYQVKLRVESPNIIPYENRFSNSIDSEREVIDFQYRKLEVYGKGINVAVDWGLCEVGTKFLETTYLPESEINSYSNAANSRLQEKNLDWIFELKNLSIWSTLSKKEILEGLSDFVATYNEWIQNQDNTSPIGRSLISKQDSTKKRLFKNISFLDDNVEAFKAFQLANTAMLIQMIIARDTNFSKGRDFSDLKNFNANDLNFFMDYIKDGERPSYRPFQLAFLLMNVEPTFEKQSTDRINNLDLIWFPTGGGKTEAYLALTALTIIERKMHFPKEKGVSVIMRYTLRLLTAQQFERATMLICALEFLRKKMNEQGKNVLGDQKITIGMWVGQTTTPNRIADLNHYPFNRLNDEINRNDADLSRKVQRCKDANRFPVTYCPWCGCNLISLNQNGVFDPFRGYSDFYETKSLKCINSNCFYHGQAQQDLPLMFIDEQIYNNPPTLLFATVDKMVQLSHRAEPGQMFNSNCPPDLIIQDELHLLTGPLGTLTGLYEVLIDELCTGLTGIKPKIVASTATTRNTESVVKLMFNRQLNVFPPLGTEYSDSFFSFIDPRSKRKHIGFLPTGHSVATTEIKLVAAIYEAKIKSLKEFLAEKVADLNHLDVLLPFLNSDDFKEQIDPYWTLVLYYNSLKDLGKSMSRVELDFKDQIKGLFKDNEFERVFRFVVEPNMFSRATEFTSRQDSGKIKALLSRISTPIAFKINPAEGGNRYLNEDGESIDLALATNMFSVGIDVSRLNLMIMMGQPGSVAEYIQASSRVARERKGLVINVLNPMRARELSIFEDYIAFHKAYYKNVEPLSITPFTQMAVDKLLDAVLLGYLYHGRGLTPGQTPTQEMIDDLKHGFFNRELEGIILDYINLRIDSLNDRLTGLHGQSWSVIKKEFDTMNSLRDIDAEVFIKNQNLNYN
jgi:hypothetical protein